LINYFQITWSHNGEPIERTSKHYSITVQQDMHMYISKLSLSKSHHGKDDGTYQVDVKNSYGQKASLVKVNIECNYSLNLF
jgi:hypothetical protein